MSRVGYKLSAPLYCFDCKRLRNRMAMEVRDDQECLVGHRCIKCTQKGIVSNRPKGTGWRMAFRHMMNRINRPKKKESEVTIQ